jgi:hypothetical protein
MLVMVVAAALAALATVRARQPDNPPEFRVPAIRFEAIDVFVDSGAIPLGAYQIEIKAVSTPGAGLAPDVKLVGVEGGGAAAYKQPPYYDPAALHENQLQDRVVIAAYSTAADLPTGRTRVARLHAQVAGHEPAFTLNLMTAGGSDGRRIEAKATYAPAPKGAQPGSH